MSSDPFFGSPAGSQPLIPMEDAGAPAPRWSAPAMPCKAHVRFNARGVPVSRCYIARAAAPAATALDADAAFCPDPIARQRFRAVDRPRRPQVAAVALKPRPQAPRPAGVVAPSSGPPDKAAAAAWRQRLHGLQPAQAEDLRRAVKLLQSGDRLLSGQLLWLLRQQAPAHAEVLRWSALRHAELAEWADAADCLQRAVAVRADDQQLWLLLARAQEHAGQALAALPSLQAAMGCQGDAQSWFALSVECDRQGAYEQALQAIEQALRQSARAAPPPAFLLQRSRCLKALGQAAQAAADCRALIASGRERARAWFALVDLKTVPLSADELQQLQATAAAPPATLPAGDRMLLDFALGKALEDAGQPADAFAVLARANRAAQATHRWDADAFARHVDAVRHAFGPQSAPALLQPENAAHAGQGREVIFLVGLPRSGTTLVEQVLAAHPAVEGASELPYLQQVIDAESQARRQPFPDWCAAASAADWARLGQDYLRRSAHWRASKPTATDKLPENWLLAGAVMAMLPAARIIDCRRDPVETCWSCYKQLFGPGRVGFTYAFDDLAAYWQAYDSLCRLWAEHWPLRFRAQSYEALVAAPEAQIRAVLDFCGLPFDAACLQFHTAQRAIRTPSALQVRQPLTRTSTPAAQYGALLGPLRDRLAAAARANAAAAADQPGAAAPG